MTLPSADYRPPEEIRVFARRFVCSKIELVSVNLKCFAVTKRKGLI
jgi:hypothetical protein